MENDPIKNTTVIDEESIKSAWCFLSRMRGLEVVNESTLIEAKMLLDDVDLLFSRITKVANAEVQSRKQSLSNLYDQIDRVVKPYEETRNELLRRINLYAQFKREIASRERYDIGTSIEVDHKQIEEEYRNQMLAERERLEKIRKEELTRKIAGYILEDPVELLQSIILGEVTSSVINVDDKVLMEIGRRYQFKIRIPGIKWVWKNKRGDFLDEISTK